MMRQWMRLCEDGSGVVHAYRGFSGGHDKLDTTFGVFFASQRHDAMAYANGYTGHGSGQVIEADIDISNALDWTTATNVDFQNYVISCRQSGKSPPGVNVALTRYNQRNGGDATLREAIGYLLRESPQRLSHHEIDPLMGYVRGYIRNNSNDVIIRPHDTGGGMISGKEYIVFAASRIKLQPTL